MQYILILIIPTSPPSSRSTVTSQPIQLCVLILIFSHLLTQGFPFVFPKYSWKGLPWNMPSLPQITPLKKTECPSLNSCQMPVTPQLGVGHYTHLSPSCWDFFFSGLSLQKPDRCCHSGCEFMCSPALLCLESIFFSL